MAFYLVNSLKNEDVHGTDNTKKTACGIKYSTPDAAKLFALGKEMHDIKELTCDRCKEVLAMKMIKESNKQMAQERKEERKKSKQAAKSVDYIPAPETKTNYTAPRPVAKNQPEKAAKNDKPKEDFKVNGEFIPKSLRKYGNDNPFGTKNEEVTAKDEAAAAEVVQEENAQEVATETVVETPAVQQSAISGIAPINIPGIDIVAPQPTGFVSEVTNEVPKPTPAVAPINIPGIDIIEPPTAPIIEPEPVKEEKKPVDMIDFSDFEDLRPKKKESKPLDFDDLDDFIIGTPMSRKPAVAVSVEEFKVPEIPSVPVVNTAHAMPEIPSVPVVNTAPAMPEIPSVPVVNTAPVMPEIPSVPVVNTAPVMPEIPSVPVVNTAPVMPEIPSVSVVNPTPVVAKKPVVAPLDKSVSAPPLSEASTMSDVERPVITSMDTAPSRPNIRMTTNAIDDDIIAVPSFASSRPAVADSVEDAAPVPVITSLEDVEKALNKMQGIETIDEPVEEEPEVVVPAFKEYKPMSKTEIEKRKLERVQKSEPDRPLSRAEQKRLEKEEKKKAKIDAEFAKDMAKRGITSDSMRDRRRR